jgi:hypothetical protein
MVPMRLSNGAGELLPVTSGVGERVDRLTGGSMATCETAGEAAAGLGDGLSSCSVADAAGAEVLSCGWFSGPVLGPATEGLGLTTAAAATGLGLLAGVLRPPLLLLGALLLRGATPHEGK